MLSLSTISLGRYILQNTTHVDLLITLYNCIILYRHTIKQDTIYLLIIKFVYAMNWHVYGSIFTRHSNDYVSSSHLYTWLNCFSDRCVTLPLFC